MWTEQLGIRVRSYLYDSEETQSRETKSRRNQKVKFRKLFGLLSKMQKDAAPERQERSLKELKTATEAPGRAPRGRGGNRVVRTPELGTATTPSDTQVTRQSGVETTSLKATYYMQRSLRDKTVGEGWGAAENRQGEQIWKECRP